LSNSNKPFNRFFYLQGKSKTFGLHKKTVGNETGAILAENQFRNGYKTGSIPLGCFF